MSESKPQNNFGPFLTMVFLFFIVGFLTTANSQFLGPLKNAFLKNSGSFQNTMATMITFSWFLAYPVFGGVGSWLVRNSGYKGTLIRGLWVMTGGVILTDASAWTTLLWPSAMITLPGEAMVHFGFLIFLLGSFVIGGSVTILQVVINPYLVAIDVKGTQPVQRLAIGGTLNSLGTTLAPYFVTGIVFGGLALNKITVDQIIIPFIVLAAVLVIVMIIVHRLRLPNLDKTVNKDGERLERSIWSFRHLALGVVAISFYVGSEVCVGSNINLYVLDDFSGSTTTAMLMATLYWGGLMVGRLIGSSLRKITPRTQLAVTTTAASILVLTAMLTNQPWALVAVGLFHSIMWGCIYTLSVAHLGKYTVKASGVFMIGVVGGAVLPLLQGMFADALGNWRWSWSLVLCGELVMLAYALVGCHIRNNDIIDKDN